MSVAALIIVMLMKMSSSQTAENSLDMLSTLLKQQVDYSQIGESTMKYFNAFLDDIEFLHQTESANTDVVTLQAPLSEGTITESYTSGTHPLLSADTEPVGITIKTSKGAFVVCAENAVITSKTTNADGTYKAVLSLNDNPALSLVYDGMIACYFDIGDSVARSQILGMLPSKESEDSACLKFGVYLNNVPQDPMPYLGDIYTNES